ncbi:phosphoglycolate phosphatase [Escherichia coli]|nr:phosphoglycolate phosphatase [Escherichia coli]
MALYALELPVAGEERVITWIGNGADILMERALTWARQERATLRKTMGKPPVDDDIPAEEQVRILRKTVRSLLWRGCRRGDVFVPARCRYVGRVPG